jgi:hypothetical protein
MASLAPTRKVWSGLAVGQVAAVATWAASNFWQVIIPVEVAMPLAGLAITIVQYFVPDKESR